MSIRRKKPTILSSVSNLPTLSAIRRGAARRPHPRCRLRPGLRRRRTGAQRLPGHRNGPYIPRVRSAPHDLDFIRWDLDRKEFPVNVSQFDQIFMLDIIEHLKSPEDFMEELRFATGRKRPELIITTANIGFFMTRLMLLFGQFNYGKKGILDATHTRLFTFRSLSELLKQSDYQILEMRGIPAPFPKPLAIIFSRAFSLG